jgi:hypothetical protein
MDAGDDTTVAREDVCPRPEGQRIRRTNQLEGLSKQNLRAYSLTLKMEATCSSEMTVDFQQTT